MHHFFCVRWILLDAIGNNAIKRRMNHDDCTILMQTLEDFMLGRFFEPQESFRLLRYALDLFIYCWFSCHINHLHTSMVL